MIFENLSYDILGENYVIMTFRYIDILLERASYYFLLNKKTANKWQDSSRFRRVNYS